MKPGVLLGLVLALTAGICAAEPRLSQPANVGIAKIAATRYHNSGAYARDLASVAARAETWILSRARHVKRPALVLDIDDTSLSNWSEIVANDFGRFVEGPCLAGPNQPCGWRDWDLKGADPAIPATLRLYRAARAAGVAVFFITGRPESQRRATERNLRRVGYTGFSRLDMVPEGARFASAADFKAPRRRQIEAEGYRIIANMGDQHSDLAGGAAERTFLLPNPFYYIP
ncbi:HAD family acid phosphatase [Rhodoligotrophos defluvii]|uniref:HAD family acid phosphatase n=1 Tax=Rhodoligotrophos defluvii TaxID=2561934 RepID=UPI0010C94602|nr:HAD family acid phosphatase [Rhodoligotrophos defluvii]